VTFGQREIGEIVRCLPDKKPKFHLAIQLLLLDRLHPKSARPARDNALESAPDFIQIGSLLAELQPNA